MRRSLRTIVGFVIAPLVPVTITIVPDVAHRMVESGLTPVEAVRRFFEFGHFPVAFFQITTLSAVLTTAIYGLLLLAILRRRNWLRLLPSIFAGAASGFIAIPIALFLYAWRYMPDPFGNPILGDAVRGFWWPGLIFGAVIAAIIWLIARPDRA